MDPRSGIIQEVKRISEIIDRMISSNPRLENLKLFSVKAAWEQAVGGVISRKAKVVDIRKDVLVVLCKDPMWKGEILLRKRKILEKINEIVGEKAFRDIKIRQR